MKKRAAFVVSEYNENVFYGGGEKVNYYIIKELIKRNYDVDIYTSVSFVEKSNIVNIYLKNNNYKTKLKDYDLVLSTNLECESNITFSHNHSYAFEQKLVKIPSILKTVFSKSHNKKLKKDKIAKQNAGLISNIVVSSNILKDDYTKNYKIPEWKIQLLYPGVEYKEENIILPDRKCINFGIIAGKFGYKGGFIVLFAILRLKRKYKNFKVKFIVKKNKKKLIFLAKILGIEKFTEFLNVQKDMTKFYQSINFMLIPSIKEAFGLVVTEAMSFSKIPIVSSVCGAADLIKDNENGIIIDYSEKNKTKMLVEKMEKAIFLSDEDYIRISRNANYSVKQLSWDNFAQKYVNIAETKIKLNDIKISVVIPIYNAEKYIAQCLNSIINQTIKDIEIICVNESSTDNTTKILETFKRYDSRIKVINKEKSGSSSEGRNYGIKCARGKYIYFIDNDDLISNEYLENMYKTAEKENADIVINDNINAFYEDDLKTQKPFIKHPFKNGIYTVTPSYIQERHTNSLPWSKLYKKEFLKKNNLKFPAKYIYEDEYFYFTLMPFLNEAVQCNCGMYYYRQRKSSIMGKGKIEQKYQIFDIFKQIYVFYKEHSLIGKYKLPYSILKYRSSQISDYKKYRRKFLELINELGLNPHEIILDKKLRLLLISSNKFLYRINGIINKKYEMKLSEEYRMLYEIDEE